MLALRKIPVLPEAAELLRMKPESLTLRAAVTLIQIMRRQAHALNARFGTSDWTPRKVDMVLWATR